MNNGKITEKPPNIWKLNTLLNNFMSQKNKSQGK